MMLTSIQPKLPMRSKSATTKFYVAGLGFKLIGEYDDYLILERDAAQIHFFLFEKLVPEDNYGQVYIRTDNIDALYKSFQEKNVSIHPNGHLQHKPWGQKEFSLIDPDNNLLTFGQSVTK